MHITTGMQARREQIHGSTWYRLHQKAALLRKILLGGL